MHRRHPIWYGLGFAIIPFFVLFIGYTNIHPEIYRSTPRGFDVSNDEEIMGINWGDEDKKDPPLEYVSDSLRGISISTQVVEVTSFWSLWNAPSSQLEYKWTYKVKNLTDTTLNISVIYDLEGKNDEVVASTNASKTAEPDETIEFEELGRLDYRDAHRVTGSGWSISHRKAP